MTATRADWTPMVLAYIACIAAGAAVLFWAGLPPLWDVLVADVVATLVIFGYSWRYRNSSFYDAYWSVIPPLLAVYWYWQHLGTDIDGARALLVIALVWFWGIRLTLNWGTHWGGLGHEDWRYPMVRARAGRWARLADLGGIHLFPTFQVLLACLPIYAVMSRGAAPLGWLDAVAALVTFGAVCIEMIADLQLHAFLKRRTPGAIINEGLWSWSRHPNYFGEISFWWGLALFGLAAAPEAWWWVLPGALSMTLMFAFASIPMMDRRSCERRPAYAEHMRRVSALVPLPPKR